jgi:site-specific recombinase XerD
MSHRIPPLADLLESQIQTLGLTLRSSTVNGYRTTVHNFLAHLQRTLPRLPRLAQLRRDPHLLGWMRNLTARQPKTRREYLLQLRRLLDDLAENGYLVQPGLILRQDFPPIPHYLPRALSPEDDQLLQQELRRADDLPSHALLLTRATGMRIGECVDLTLDCLRGLGEDRWALHVPLGKLLTERLVPADRNIQLTVARIHELRALAPPYELLASAGLLLPRSGDRLSLCDSLRNFLANAAQRACCSQRIIPHQLRHTFASEMLRLGVSLPALMQLLGHKDIRMTLRYLLITQDDLQQQFHLARQQAGTIHHVPNLSLPSDTSLADPPGILQAIATTRHLLEMFRRQLAENKIRHQLQRLDKRLLNIAASLQQLTKPEK